VRNTSWLRTAVASLAICAIGGALLWGGTAGFRAFTSEQARRRAIAERPRALPVVDLEDQDGRPFTLTVYHGRPLAVDFVYTQCVSVCTILSAGFQRLDRAERSRFESENERLQLVSISFDPRDTPDRLREYASRYQADGRTWRFARVRDARDLPQILRSFGIVVIPDGRGDFQHNAAVHVVNGDGRLARVLDLSADPADIARAAAASGR
jgi:protein SCO1